MKRIFVIAILMMVVLSACGTSAPAAAPASTIAPVVAQATMAPTTAPAIPTEVPAATPTTAPPTQIPAATAASAPTGAVPAIIAGQQWFGYDRQAESGHSLTVQLFIKTVTDTSFTGTMWWHYYSQPSTETKIHGDIITDITSATEQNRWAFIKDFNTDKSGTWLRWTETDFLVGSGYQALGGWYYVHLRSDGHLVGIYFENAKNPNPEADTYDLTLTTSSVPSPTP